MTNSAFQLLYDEHTIIVSAIDISQKAGKLIGIDDEQYEQIIRQLLHFFRSYADQFHHYKEEIILFPDMNKQNELLEDGIIKEMLENHEDFRGLICEIERNLNQKQFQVAQSILQKYGEALLNHIAVENEEVFQLAESIFSAAQIEKINYQFLDCDRNLGEQKKEELEMQLEALKKHLFLN